MTHDDDVAAAILGYLEEHPHGMDTLEGIAEWWIDAMRVHGMDTLEGIAEWWIARQRVRVNVAAVARVLERLTEGGAVEVVSANGHRLYRRKDQTLEAATRP